MMEKAGRVQQPSEARGLALLFGRGGRPGARHVRDLLSGPEMGEGVVLGHQAEDGCASLELLCGGLAFDLTGLAPGPMPTGQQVDDLEPVLLSPGPHLKGGAHLLPVLRAHLALGLALSSLPGLRAMVWAPAGRVMAVDAFVRTMAFWLEGGPFPALALVALRQEEEEGLAQTRGLAFLIGRELRITPAPGQGMQALRTLAIVLIDHLMRQQAGMALPLHLTGPDGAPWIVEPLPGQTLLMARRSG